MTLPIILRSWAREEYERAIGWYLDQDPEVADRFEAAVEALFKLLADHPKRYPVVLRDIREAPVMGFPYSVHYRVRSGRLIVLSVFHSSRDPQEWQSRV